MNTKRVGLIAGATALVAVVAFIVVVALVDGFDSDDNGSSPSDQRKWRMRWLAAEGRWTLPTPTGRRDRVSTGSGSALP